VANALSNEYKRKLRLKKTLHGYIVSSTIRHNMQLRYI